MHNEFAQRYTNNVLFQKYHAWCLATCPYPELRDPARAVEIAQKAIELGEEAPSLWNPLGVALYRAGHPRAAVDALKNSTTRRSGGDPYDWFFLAMAHWQLGNKEQARKEYDRSVTWVQKQSIVDHELRRFQAEAATLLGLSAPPTSQRGSSADDR